MSLKNLLRLVISILTCQAAGYIGSLFTSPSIPTWYASLNKPSLAPPNWVFFPVWTALFLMMGISLYLLWTQALKDRKAKIALIFFAVQLGLNILWSILFFGLKSPLSALIEILILWLAILLTIIKSLKVSKAAAILLLPYILWVSFAAVLNFFLWKLNA